MQIYTRPDIPEIPPSKKFQARMIFEQGNRWWNENSLQTANKLSWSMKRVHSFGQTKTILIVTFETKSSCQFGVCFGSVILIKTRPGFWAQNRRIGQRLIKPIESVRSAETFLTERSELVSPKKFRKGWWSSVERNPFFVSVLWNFNGPVP